MAISVFQDFGHRLDPGLELFPEKKEEPKVRHCSVARTTADPQIGQVSNIFIDSAPCCFCGCNWWAVQDLNLRPPVCKTDALPLS